MLKTNEKQPSKQSTIITDKQSELILIPEDLNLL